MPDMVLVDVGVKHMIEKAGFETYVFSSYARLNEERREILETVQQRGRVYG